MSRQSSKEKAAVNIVEEEIKEEVKQEKPVVEDTVVEKPEEIKVIQTTNNVTLRKFPNLNNKDVIGISPVNAKYKVVLEIKNDNGTFYKLSNGNYIHVDTTTDIIRIK